MYVYTLQLSTYMFCRPMTSHGFNKSLQTGGTIYDEAYKEKPYRPTSPIRSGSATGTRNNKPHPTEVCHQNSVVTKLCH